MWRNLQGITDYQQRSRQPHMSWMQCFKRSSRPLWTDPLQFVYRQKWSTGRHSQRCHSHSTRTPRGFIDYSAALNTVIPHKLWKAAHPGTCAHSLELGAELANMQSPVSQSKSLHIQRGRVLSLPCCTSSSHTNCTASKCNISNINFAVITAVIGPTTGGDKMAHRMEAADLVAWCHSNNLSLQTRPSKWLLTQRGGAVHTTAHRWDRGLEVLCIHTRISPGLTTHATSSRRTTALAEKAEEIWHARQNSEQLFAGLSVWKGNCPAQDRKPLQYQSSSIHCMSSVSP